jgi:hypothetical protein
MRGVCQLKQPGASLVFALERMAERNQFETAATLPELHEFADAGGARKPRACTAPRTRYPFVLPVCLSI